MRTKQRIANLLLALVIAFATIPTSTLAVGTSNAAVTKPSFEIAFSVPAFEDTLVFSEKPVRVQWGIDDGPYRIAFVFPLGTKVSLVDETDRLIEIFTASESYLGDITDSWEFGDCRTESTLELTLDEELGFDPNGVRLCDTGLERGLLPVMVDGVTESTIDPGDSIIYAWELDPTVPVPPDVEITFDRYLEPSSWSQSDSDMIVNIANDITAKLTDDRAKARAIHRWVAKSVWYDHDGDSGAQDAVSIAAHRYGICEGYASLTVALLRAVGIPADTVSGNNEAANTGHIWVKAYVDGRWINMDPTWDSNNHYRNGSFSDQHEPGTKWFDPPSDRFNRDYTPDTDELYQLILDEGLAATEIWPDGSTEQPNDGIAA